MSWADEYAKGRAAQVEQQRIANLLAATDCHYLDHGVRARAAEAAAVALGVTEQQAKEDA